MSQLSAGTRFRQAVKESNPLAVVGCVNAYFARLATQSGFKAVYLSGGGVAACSCGIPDLGITTMEDVLIDARRITDNVDTPLLVDIDVGRGVQYRAHDSQLRACGRGGGAYRRPSGAEALRASSEQGHCF